MHKDKVKNFLKSLLLPTCVFCACLLILAIIFAINGFSLFSHNKQTIISYDMQSQYITYLMNYKHMLLNDGHIDVYSFNKSIGGDFLSLWAYYLASPFNYLLPLISDIDIPLFVLWTSLIKLSLGAVFMYLLLVYERKHYNIAFIGLALAYGLLSYGLIYISNFMWLDGVMILPLIILGLRKIEGRENPAFYIFALAYSLIANWYIAGLSIIFIVLFFLARLIAMTGNKKDRLYFLLRFIIFSLLAGLISSINWYVAFSHFSGTKATGSIPKFFEIDLPMLFTGALENGYSEANQVTINFGYLPIFASITILALAMMYFFNKKYDLKSRLSYLGIITIYALLSMTNVFNALLHGGREPTWFPGRFGFVLSFFFIYLAGLEIDQREGTPIWGILSPLATMSVVSPIILLMPNKLLKNEVKTYQISVISLIIYLFVVILMLLDYLLRKKKINCKYQGQILTALICGLTIISSFRGENNILKTNNAKTNFYQTYETYQEDLKYQGMFEKDDIYRSETLFNRPGNYNQINNNPLFYSYNGLSHFSSTSKKDVDNYLSKLGFHYNGYFLNYDAGSTASINTLLGIKYLYDDENIYDSNPTTFIKQYPYEKKELGDDLYQYTNVDALSLMFMANKTNDFYISEGHRVDGHEGVYWYDDFEYQNQIFKTFSGLSEDIFTPLEMNNFSTSGNITYTKDEYGFKYLTGEKGGYIAIDFRYNGVINNHINFYLGEKNLLDATFYIDGFRVGENSYWHKGIRGFSLSDNYWHSLKIYLSKDVNNQQIRPELYAENIDILENHLAKIKLDEPEMKIIKTGASYGIKANCQINHDNRDLIFTLPYENNFRVYVDGKRMETYKKWNIFTAIDMSQINDGEHEIKIVYRDKAYLSSLIISPIVFVGSLTYCILYYINKDFFQSFFKKKKED